MRGTQRQAWIRGGRARTIAILAVLIGIAVAATVAAVGFGGRGNSGGPGRTLPPATALVTRGTLTQTTRLSGTLDYGDVTTLTARAGRGTITWLPSAGTVVGRGQPVYKVDDKPVPLLYGSLPLYRLLTTNVSGADVQQLEDNLRALGYAGFTVDKDYTTATAAAVKAWQSDLDRPKTGTVDLDEVVFAPGELRVTELMAGVWLGDHWFTVVGVLDRVPLAPELDSAALVGWPVAQSRLAFDGYATTLFTRTRDDAVTAVQAVLAATANPEHPEQVQVSRPSDALAARQAVDQALRALLLGLGAVALLVGGIGVANTMVISVLERRTEIGLRRALGATRSQIRLQFLTESLLLSSLGGLGGVALGIAVTTGYAAYLGWPSVVPAWATAGGVGATMLAGTLAGLYPAWRAARLSPTEALGAQ